MGKTPVFPIHKRIISFTFENCNSFLKIFAKIVKNLFLSNKNPFFAIKSPFLCEILENSRFYAFFKTRFRRFERTVGALHPVATSRSIISVKPTAIEITPASPSSGTAPGISSFETT